MLGYFSGLALRLPFLWESHVKLFLEHQRVCEVSHATWYHCWTEHLWVCRNEPLPCLADISFCASRWFFFLLLFIKTTTLFVQSFLYKWTRLTRDMINKTHELTNSLHIPQTDDGCSPQFAFCRLVISGMILYKTRTQIFHHTHMHTHTASRTRWYDTSNFSLLLCCSG